MPQTQTSKKYLLKDPEEGENNALKVDEYNPETSSLPGGRFSRVF